MKALTANARILARVVLMPTDSAAGAVAAGLFKTVTPVFIKDYIPFGSSAPELAGVAFGAGLVVQLLTAPLGVTSNLLVAERRLAGVVRFALRRQTAHPAASIEVIN